MKAIRQFLKIIKYGWLLDYHQSKRNKINPKHQTVLKYHLEMSEHYYEKIYGEREK